MSGPCNGDCVRHFGRRFTRKLTWFKPPLLAGESGSFVPFSIFCFLRSDTTVSLGRHLCPHPINTHWAPPVFPFRKKGFLVDAGWCTTDSFPFEFNRGHCCLTPSNATSFLRDFLLAFPVKVFLRVFSPQSDSRSLIGRHRKPLFPLAFSFSPLPSKFPPPMNDVPPTSFRSVRLSLHPEKMMYLSFAPSPWCSVRSLLSLCAFFAGLHVLPSECIVASRPFLWKHLSPNGLFCCPYEPAFRAPFFPRHVQREFLTQSGNRRPLLRLFGLPHSDSPPASPFLISSKHLDRPSAPNPSPPLRFQPQDSSGPHQFPLIRFASPLVVERRVFGLSRPSKTPRPFSPFYD